MSVAEGLRRVVEGDVFEPGDDGYETATRTWDLAKGNRPRLALAASSVHDIAVGARWADENDRGVAILNAGHGWFSSQEECLVISVGALNAVRVDPRARRAVVGPGATWADVSAIASPLRLVGASGASAGVGVIGYTLGGGLGPLGRTLGFASDRVSSLTVLDADYRPQRLDAQDGDRFWALRGGGPLGLVTEMVFDLDLVAPFFGGGVYFDGHDAVALLTAYAQWLPGIDDRTTTSVALLHLPDVPQIVPKLRGRFVAHLRLAYVDHGSHDIDVDGRELLAPLLAAANPILDATRVLTVAELPDIHRDPVAPQAVTYRGGFVDALDAATITALTREASAGTASPRMIEVRHLGGAYARPAAAVSSATGRSAAFNLYATAPATSTSQALVDGVVRRISGSDRGQFNFYGPAPARGQILGLWDEPDAARLVAVADDLDPRRRISTGRPLR